MALPKIIYGHVYYDITKAYHEGELETMDWFNRIKAVCEDFEKEYPNEKLIDYLPFQEV